MRPIWAMPVSTVFYLGPLNGSFQELWVQNIFEWWKRICQVSINSPNSISRNVAIKGCTPYLKKKLEITDICKWHTGSRMSCPWRTCCCCCCRPVLQKISLQKQPHKAKLDWYFYGVFCSSVLLWRRQLLGTRKGCMATWHSTRRI